MMATTAPIFRMYEEVEQSHLEDALCLLKEFVHSCGRYCGAVAAQTMGSRKPDINPMDEEHRSWQREAESLNRSRTLAHEAVITNYKVLTRFCTSKGVPLSITKEFSPTDPRDKIGDLAWLTHTAEMQKREVIPSKLNFEAIHRELHDQREAHPLITGKASPHILKGILNAAKSGDTSAKEVLSSLKALQGLTCGKTQRHEPAIHRPTLAH